MDQDTPHQTFENPVVPAPRKGEKARGVRSGEARFALAMTRLMNRMGSEGWEFVRADTLPAEERVGLTGKELKYHTLLVFRRATAPQVMIAPAPVQPALEQAPAPKLLTAASEWDGFDEAEPVEEAEVIELLAARRTKAAQ